MGIEDVLDRAADEKPQKGAAKPEAEADDDLEIIMPRGIGEGQHKAPRDEEGDDEDERLNTPKAKPALGGDDDPDDDKPGDRRSKKQRHREAYRNRRNAEKSELQELRSKLAELEARDSQRGQQQQQLSADAIKARYETLQANEAGIQARIALAVTEGRGDEAVKAFRESQAITTEMQGLTAQWNQLQQAQKAPPQKAQPTGDDPVSAWKEVNDWFDPDLGDKDSRRAAQIDQDLAAEGRFKPGSAGYMIELTKRITKEMPHVYESDEEDEPPQRQARRPARGGPPMSGGNGGRPPSPGAGKRQIDLNDPMYRDAIVSMGIENDPAAIKKWASKWAAWREDPENKQKMAIINARMGR